MSRSNFFGLAAKPSKKLSFLLGALPFLLVLIFYYFVSEARYAENEHDKLLPTFEKISAATKKAAFEENKRSGEIILWQDTIASLKRLSIGILAAAVTGLFLGLNLGMFPGFFALLQPFITFISIIPPLAILPILFLVFGVEEFAKIFLIFIGTAPVITRDIMFTAKKLPTEHSVKALTLGASSLQYVYLVALPQMLPRLIESVRLALGAAWLFLIASEAIAAEAGLGYRIFLVRRYLAMDTIIPYALWITLLGITFDLFLRWLNRYFFPWYGKDK